VADGSKTFDFSGRRASSADAIGSFTLKTKAFPNGEDFEIRALKDSAPMFLAHQMNIGTQTQKLVAVIDFMHKAMTPDSAKRFADLATDPVNGLDWEEMMESKTEVETGLTSCLTLSFLAATIAHLTSSNVISSYQHRRM